MTTPRQIRPLVRVALPVVVASLLIILAVINVVLVKPGGGEPEDGVLWTTSGVNVIAKEIAKDKAGDRAGIRVGDVLLQIDGAEVTSTDQVISMFHHAARDGAVPVYVVQRANVEPPIA